MLNKFVCCRRLTFPSRRDKQDVVRMLEKVSKMSRTRLLAVSLVVASANAASAAPPQLLNKTINTSFTALQLNRDPDGRTSSVQTGVVSSIYVSSAGRLFERGTRAVGNTAQTGDVAPGSKQNARGEARGLHFSGNTIVSETKYASGAYRSVITFNSTFTSCSIEATWGREGNQPLKRVGIDGVTREILSISASGATCSIQDGNAFAK